MMEIKSINGKIIFIIGLAVVIVGFMLSVAASFTPYTFATNVINPMDVTGKYSLSIEAFTQILFKVRLLAILFLIVCGAMIWFRDLLINFCDNLVNDANEFKSFLKCYVKNVKPQHYFILIAIVILGFGLRAYFMDYPMRCDESDTYKLASLPFYMPLCYYPAPNNQVLHSILMNLSLSAFGKGLWAVRLPALLFGLMLIPLTYLLICSYFHKNSALLGALLMAFTPVAVFFSVNGRGYSMIMAFSIILLLITKRLWSSSNPFLWLLWVLSSGFGLYVNPTMLYSIALSILFLFTSEVIQKKNLFKSSLIRQLLMAAPFLFGLTFILYSPIIAASGLEAITGNQYVVPGTYMKLFSGIPSIFPEIFNNWIGNYHSFLQVLLGVFLAIGLIFYKKYSSLKFNPIIPILISMMALLLIFRRIPPARVWVYLLPLFIGFTSSGVSYLLDSIKRKTIKKLICFITSIAAVLVFSQQLLNSGFKNYSYGASPDIHDVALYLKKCLGSDDRLVSHTPVEEPMEYYFEKFQIPMKVLLHNNCANTKCYVYVNLFTGQTLSHVLKKKGLHELEGDFKLLKSYPVSLIYANTKALEKKAINREFPAEKVLSESLK